MKTKTKIQTTKRTAVSAVSIEGHPVPTSSPSKVLGGLLSLKGDIVKTRKATHLGTCQVCGRLQKLPHGLSVHGYTKQFGFFSGQCRGSYGNPFEKSHDLISKAIEDSKNLIEKHGVEIWELSSRPKFIWTINYNRKGQPWVKCGYEVIDGYIQPFSGYRDPSKNRDTLNSLGLRKIHLRNKSVNDVLVEANETRVRFLKRTVAELEKYIEWQEQRIADWKPTEIIPLSPLTSNTAR